MRRTLLLAAVLLLFPLTTSAEPLPHHLLPEPVSARYYDSAPPPLAAAGIVSPATRESPWSREIARVALRPLHGTISLLFAPVRLALGTYDTMQGGDRNEGTSDADASVRILPTVVFESGFGLGGGATLHARDLLGRGSRVRMSGRVGGPVHELAATWNSGTLLGDRFVGELRAAYQQVDGAPFFGYGNADRAHEDMFPAAPLDPADDMAFATRYSQQEASFGVAGQMQLASSLTLGLLGAHRIARFDDYQGAAGPDVRRVFAVSALPGYREGLASTTVELRLVYDTRRITRFYLSAAAPSTGWLAIASVGVQHADAAFGRWRADATRLVDLYAGDRVLVLRAHAAGVTGSLDEVPFTDLPVLGGPFLLRGYERGRFRDRVAALGSVEYRYPVSRQLSGYLFTEAGRVWRELSAIDGSGLRVSFGGGLRAHLTHTLLGRVGVFGSWEGNVLVYLSFDPVFDVRSENVLP